MNSLQKALKLNAIFSGMSGLTLIFFYNKIATLFGITNTTVFWIIGLSLIYFSITIWYQIFKQKRLAIQWIVVQDFVWVLGSIYLLIFKPFMITFYGNLSIAVIALIVLFMGINQLRALRCLHSLNEVNIK